jgi:hypothetical protein
MSSPSFLLANETNHTLLQSLLEALNAMLEHQWRKNPNLISAILKSKKRFEALREFTLEAGQLELERLAQQRKEQQEATSLRLSRTNSIDSVRSPSTHHSTNLQEVPEDSAFTIGDDEDEDDAEPPTPVTPQSPGSPPPRASAHSSRAASVSSSADETVPLQLRGMSEKARGKLPVGAPLLSRQNSVSSLHSLTPTITNNGSFQPTPDWVRIALQDTSKHSLMANRSTAGNLNYHFTQSSPYCPSYHPSSRPQAKTPPQLSPRSKRPNSPCSNPPLYAYTSSNGPPSHSAGTNPCSGASSSRARCSSLEVRQAFGTRPLSSFSAFRRRPCKRRPWLVHVERSMLLEARL